MRGGTGRGRAVRQREHLAVHVVQPPGQCPAVAAVCARPTAHHCAHAGQLGQIQRHAGVLRRPVRASEQPHSRIGQPIGGARHQLERFHALFAHEALFELLHLTWGYYSHKGLL